MSKRNAKLEVTERIPEKAYLFLKSYACQESLNLFLKQRVASFKSYELSESLSKITHFLNDANWKSNSNFSYWLEGKEI
jgi:hypothetical protein